MTLSIFQIIAISILGAGVLTALAFVIAFIVESYKNRSQETQETQVVEEQKDEIDEIDLDEMLAKLEEVSKKNEEKQPAVVINVYGNKKSEEIAEAQEETTEEAEVEEEAIEAQDAEEKAVIVEEDQAEEEAEEAQEETIEEEKAEVEENVSDKEETQPEVQTIVIDRSAPEFDYRIRLEKIKESQAKLEKDLDKTSRAILKYERTIRRAERNQKMLDRKALELTNLNLLMYSVTDIKNVDAEKKARQEELTAHISELKASLEDAENYVETNREKHENNLKLKDYLTREQTRYEEEIKELETLIASGKYFDDGDDTNK